MSIIDRIRLAILEEEKNTGLVAENVTVGNAEWDELMLLVAHSHLGGTFEVEVMGLPVYLDQGNPNGITVKSYPKG